MPDFIIIGAMKCATSSLHEQLSQQPGIFMTEPKEPYFFSNDEIWEKGLEWYASLYADAQKWDLCGESSTHYTKLPTYPKTILRMRCHIPDAKLIYVIRHPIDRLVSHYIHDWSERVINVPINDAIVKHPELIDYGKYATQIRPFLEAYGTDKVLLVFFEHLLADPQTEIERIAQFIGYKKKAQWCNGNASNTSAKRLRRSVWRDAVVWNPVSTWIRLNFIPQSVRDWVKGIWQMKKRPELNENLTVELEQIFNDNLTQLSQWVDVNITCQTFNKTAKVSMPNWSGRAPNNSKVG